MEEPRKSEPVVNVEETPGKTVGRRVPPADGLNPATSNKADAEAWKEAFRLAAIPKGVYKFHSHEEADEWLWKMMTRNKKD